MTRLENQHEDVLAIIKDDMVDFTSSVWGTQKEEAPMVYTPTPSNEWQDKEEEKQDKAMQDITDCFRMEDLVETTLQEKEDQITTLLFEEIREGCMNDLKEDLKWFEDDALECWNHQSDYFLDQHANPAHTRYPRYEALKAAVQQRFWKGHHQDLKYQEWEALRQSSFKSMEEFFQKFEELTKDTGKLGIDADMLCIAQNGTRKTLQDIIYHSKEAPLTMYNEWKQQVKQIDLNYHVHHAKFSNGPAPRSKTPLNNNSS
ncbi:uncharacterized protein EV420DRAFT_1645056 [Desarmillaria tabescens]|uniref:Retrotransposon gag domain-containing protein n=1 Tax=Armillaria tabescens TaxID=1929756 RepID=A0AA39K8I2_ARMTA|nr:uncharacterized protein EV420DRAFT_1645056 [Desarmillaria tabescens]KAK0454183.1 hypothetical protein EV420DRAFT_1645056 [Desarmillaria tabescens]